MQTIEMFYTYEQLVKLTTALLEYDGDRRIADYRSVETQINLFMGNHVTAIDIGLPKDLITDDEYKVLKALMTLVQDMKARELIVRIHQSLRKNIDVMDSYRAIPDRTPSGIAESEARKEVMRGHTKTPKPQAPSKWGVLKINTPSVIEPIDEEDVADVNEAIEEVIGEMIHEREMLSMTIDEEEGKIPQSWMEQNKIRYAELDEKLKNIRKANEGDPYQPMPDDQRETPLSHPDSFPKQDALTNKLNAIRIRKGLKPIVL